MSTLPPPLPPQSNKSFSISGIPGSTISGPGGISAKAYKPEDYDPASPLPLLLGIIALLAGIFLWVTNSRQSVILSGIGYFLTPFTVIVCSGVDIYWQRTRTSKHPWFIQKPNYSRILKILAVVSIVFSYPHISILANSISAWLAQVFPGLAS